MRVDKEFVLREIAGDYIIIPTGKTVLEFNGLITVNIDLEYASERSYI